MTDETYTALLIYLHVSIGLPLICAGDATDLNQKLLFIDLHEPYICFILQCTIIVTFLDYIYLKTVNEAVRTGQNTKTIKHICINKNSYECFFFFFCNVTCTTAHVLYTSLSPASH